jgi:retron-type reverse transcriptase
MAQAWKRVRSNKGAAGTDGRSIEETAEHLKTQWPAIREALLTGTYKPSPTKVVYIPKPGGGQRMLGIPSVTDRLIQQAIMQQLSPHYQAHFSSSSFGFQAGKNAWQAVSQAHQHALEGYNIAVDIDLEKFFDRVNHDILMGLLSKRIKDKGLLKLIRTYLSNGMMEGGLITQRSEGTPQGSPLSPLLSNILLDELDKELERRGHRFCRYADDVQIHVKSRRAGRSSVGSITRSQFLGYSFYGTRQPRVRCSTDSIKRFKRRVRQLTRGHHRQSMGIRLRALDRYIRGWTSYYRLVQTERLFKDIDSWIRSRLRMCLMKLWPKPRTRIRKLIRLGMPPEEAAGYGQHKRWWFYAQLHHTRFVFNTQFWRRCGYRGLSFYLSRFANT